MSILKFIPRKILLSVVALFAFTSLVSCGGIWDPADARKVSPNSKERVKKNLEEGKGLSMKKLMDGGVGGTNY